MVKLLAIIAHCLKQALSAFHLRTATFAQKLSAAPPEATSSLYSGALCCARREMMIAYLKKGFAFVGLSAPRPKPTKPETAPLAAPTPTARQKAPERM